MKQFYDLNICYHLRLGEKKQYTNKIAAQRWANIISSNRFVGIFVQILFLSVFLWFYLTLFCSQPFIHVSTGKKVCFLDKVAKKTVQNN